MGCHGRAAIPYRVDDVYDLLLLAQEQEGGSRRGGAGGHGELPVHVLGPITCHVVPSALSSDGLLADT